MGDGGIDEKEANCLVHAALLCLDEDPDERLGDMQHVVHMLKAVKLDGKGEFRYRYLEWVTSYFHSKLGCGGLDDVAKALAYLHHDCSPQMLHLALKPEIILLDDNLQAIVSSTGISKLKINDRSTNHLTLAGINGI
ncbi:hypothetical protein GIB67_029119 [Kingdonia uniflora]|uniref:Protein kinase domain-containing protein n=1 Tax=Kingdonia uniflora TaxID=39325 RepID=A0A7J7N748_9MAGN|nr:hypothetical protein GIB67_029119 [Kingdonia uniflora]